MFLEALVARIVGLEPSETVPEAALTIVQDAIAKRPPALRRQVGLFLALLRWLPVWRYGARFERLAFEQQIAVLTWFQSAPISLLRKGLWGVKALAFMGYYGRPEIGPELGYRPSSGGNDLLHV